MANIQYNNNVPNGPDDPADDQPQMLINTQNIPIWTEIDHIGYNKENGGIHKQVTMNVQNPPGLGDGTGVFYANTFDSNTWPVWENVLGSFQLMGSNSFLTNGYVTLAGGLIVQWGVTPPVIVPVVFPIPFKFNLFSIQMTPQSSTSGINIVSVTSSSLTGFTSKVNTSAGSFNGAFWIAIGN